jgi:hypothetical protein
MNTQQLTNKQSNKGLLLSGIICFVLFILVAPSISAVTLPVTIYEASYIGSQFVTSTTPVSGANVTSVVCLDRSCNSISRTIGTQQTQSSQVSISFPDQLERAGYGVYITKPGYIPYELFADIAGSGTYPRQNAYLSKVDVCQATIDTFSVVNTAYPNQPVMVEINASLNAKAYSAIDSAGPLNYVPPNIAQQYTVQTTIILDVLDNESRVVNTQTQVVSIPYSGFVPVQFSWTPTVAGKYTTRVSTLVTDSVCRSTLAQQTAKHISVINFGAKEYCYTLLQNLSISNPKPVEGSAIEVTAKAIGNYYDEFGTLHDLVPYVYFELYDDSQYVDTYYMVNDGSYYEDDVQTYTFSKKAIPLMQAGNYLIVAKSLPNACPFNNVDADTADLSFTVSKKPQTNISQNTTNPNTTTPVNQAPYWTKLDELITVQVGQSATFTFANYAFDANKDQLTYSVDTSQCTTLQCAVSSSYVVFTGIAQGDYIIPITVSDSKLQATMYVRVKVLPSNTPPILSDIADQEILVGQSIQIPLFATDRESAQLIVESIYETQQNGYSCSIDSSVLTSTTANTAGNVFNALLTCTGYAAGSGSVRVVVTETNSWAPLKDSDSFILTVVDPNQNTTAQLQVPDVYINSLGLQQNLLNLTDYYQSYLNGQLQSPSDMGRLSFTLVGQTSTQTALCFINALSPTQHHFDCWARQAGYSDVTVRAINAQGVVTTDTFRVYVLSGNNSGSDVQPVCGDAQRIYDVAQTQFTGTFCANGTLDQMPIFPQVGRSAIWTCSGIVAQQPVQVSCVATRQATTTQLTPVCGSAARIYGVTETQFTGTFCANGTQLGNPAFPVQGGQSYWSCQGTNNLGQEILASCTATRSQIIVVVDPVCGSASRVYGSNEFAFNGPLCQVGTVSGTVPLFPAIDRAVSWVCQNDGRQISCNAARVSQVAITLVVPDFTIVKNAELLIDLSQYTSQVPLGQGIFTLASAPTDGSTAVFGTSATSGVMTCTMVGSIARCQNAPNRIGTAQFIAQVSYNGLVAQDAFAVKIEQSYVNASQSPDRTSQRIYISHLDIDSVAVGGYLPITLYNDGTRSKDVKISARITDLGYQTSVGPFTVGAGQTVQRKLDFDTQSAQAGVYDVRFVVSTQDGIERIVHREIVIE